MWCPSASLAMWANAWLAGLAAPDDVLDALSLWAPRHSVTAYDAAAAEVTGLPWPDLNDAGAVSLLQTVRSSARPGTASISIALPVPGDVRGLPAGTAFQRDAISAGEALIVSAERGASIGLVPDFQYSDSEDLDDLGNLDDADSTGFEPDPQLCALSWTAYSLQSVPVAEHIDLGEAEYELRSAVRAAADALTRLRGEGSGPDVDDPRGLVAQVMRSVSAHHAPDHAPTRALRVLESAAHVDAIITVSAGLMPIATQSSSEAQVTGDALRPLSSVVRAARQAAVSAILQSAWT
jgi:hypothetical protein